MPRGGAGPPPTDTAATDVEMGGDRPPSPSRAAREELNYLAAASVALALRQTSGFVSGDGSDGRSDCHDDLSDLSD